MYRATEMIVEGPGKLKMVFGGTELCSWPLLEYFNILLVDTHLDI